MRLRTVRSTLEKALREGRLQESNGFPDVAAVKLIALDEALRGAEELKSESEEHAAAARASDGSLAAGIAAAGDVYGRVASLTASAQLVYDLRSALVQGEVAKARKILAEADIAGLVEAATSEVATAQATVEHESDALQALAQLNEARGASDLPSLEAALALAAQLQLADHPNPRFAETLRSARSQVHNACSCLSLMT